LMDAQRVADALQRCGIAFRDRVFNPMVTLWAFCWQVMAAGSTCGEAVARVLAWRVSHGLGPCSVNTGSYCQARGRLPDQMTLREVTVNVTGKGFRPSSITVVTTLLDRQVDSPADLADLYRRRWQAELNLRSLKSTMNMDVLQCKTPEMVEKEIKQPFFCKLPLSGRVIGLSC